MIANALRIGAAVIQVTAYATVPNQTPDFYYRQIDRPVDYGRTGRFLMNLMLASGGYPWTIIPVERRKDYLNAIEKASGSQNINPFCSFLSELVAKTIEGNPEAK